MFNILRNWQTVFPKWLHHLQSLQQCVRVPISSHPHQNLLSFLIVTILVGVQGYLTVLLIYLTIINKEHFFHVLIGHLYIFWRNNRDYVQPVDLCRMAVLTWLSLLIHEYVMSVHVFMSSLMSCNKQCSFAQVLELLLLIYYWDFTLCDAIVYRVVFLMSFLDCPLLLCRNTIF